VLRPDPNSGSLQRGDRAVTTVVAGPTSMLMPLGYNFDAEKKCLRHGHLGIQIWPLRDIPEVGGPER
jgi:hypothetical protein